MATSRRLVLLSAVIVSVCAALWVPGCATDDRRTRRDRERTERTERDQRDQPGDAKPTEPKPKPKPTMDPARTMTVHLLDVGQGAATLIELPCGALLVDTGGEVNEQFDSVAALKKQLDEFFARRTDLDKTIDLLVITHPHLDHVKGIPMVLDSYTVKNVVDNGQMGDDLVKTEMAALRRHTESKGIGYRGIKNGDIVKKSGLTDDVIDPFRCAEIDPVVRVLSGSLDQDPGWGTDNYGHLHFANQNNNSVVIRVDIGNGSLLITGDLEERAIKGLIARYQGTRWLDVDVYEAGHHGSHNGTTRELMKSMSPLVALIAMGPSSRQQSWTAWAYGHPREKTVELLEEVGLSRPTTHVPVGTGMKRFSDHALDRAVYGTGWDGPVVVDLNVDGEVVVR